jgi:uncharacterized Tic20 family protein
MAKMEEAQEKTWGMLCHLSALSGFIIPFGNIIGPLICWLVKKDESEYVDKQGKESLNFQISVTIYALVAAVLVLIVIGIILLIAIGIAVLILVIVASIKASNREEFSYPLTIRFIQ